MKYLALVIDRSGSMADARKMDYAKSAIRSLAERMGERDRMALVMRETLAEFVPDLAPSIEADPALSRTMTKKAQTVRDAAAARVPRRERVKAQRAPARCFADAKPAARSR
jgi:Mg-chelatase subunit ChlD